jgi:hypothetical protein
MTLHPGKASRRKILWLALFLVGCFFLGNTWAAPVLKDMHFPADIYEGQAVQLKLVFEWPAEEGEFEIQPPAEIGLNNIKFLGLNRSKETSSSDSGPVSRVTLAYELLPLQTGQGTVGRFDVLYRKPQEAWKKISVSSLVLEIKPPLAWKWILILLAILATIVIPVAAWFLRSTSIQRERERNFKVDPKQELYKNAVKKFNEYITGHTEDYFRTFLSGWSEELVKVILTHYDVPLRPATPTELLKGLKARQIPAGELQEIKSFFDRLEQMQISAWSMTTAEIEKMRLSLLQYTQCKIILESPHSYQ